VGRFQVQPGRIRPVSLTRRYHSTTLLFSWLWMRRWLIFIALRWKSFKCGF
jgi:hypothetical protein